MLFCFAHWVRTRAWHRIFYCDLASALLWLQNLKHLRPVSCLLARKQFYDRTLVPRIFHEQARTWRRDPRCLRCVCVLSAGMFVRRACSFSTAIFRLPLCPPAPLVYGSKTQRPSSAFYTHIWYVWLHVEADTMNLWDVNTSSQGQRGPRLRFG